MMFNATYLLIMDFDSDFLEKEIFSYIVAVSFIDGGNWSTQRNHRLVASHWQTVSHNVVSSTPRHERGSNSQL